MKYIPNSQLAVATFTLAIDRPTAKDKEKKTDFPRVIVYGRQAENCEKYLAKGRKVAIQGSIQTGSYQNKDGQTVYTADVVANRVQFLEWGDKKESPKGNTEAPADIPEGFSQLSTDDIPF